MVATYQQVSTRYWCALYKDGAGLGHISRLLFCVYASRLLSHIPTVAAVYTALAECAAPASAGVVCSTALVAQGLSPIPTLRSWPQMSDPSIISTVAALMASGSGRTESNA
jgi:hypothetical protein